MAAGNIILVDKAIEKIFDGTFSLESDTWYCALVTSAHGPNKAADITYNDISGSICPDADYAAKALTFTVSETSGTITVDADDVDFGNSVNIEAKYAYIVRGTAATPVTTDEILCYCDLNLGGNSVKSVAGDFDIVWNGSGLFTASLT